MMGWYGGMGWGAWLGMGLFWLLLIVLIILLVVRLLPSMRPDGRGDGGDARRESPEDILDRRFAQGEIDQETYQQQRQALTQSRGLR